MRRPGGVSTLWLVGPGRVETKKGVDALEGWLKLVVEEDGRVDAVEGLSTPEEAGDALKD